MKALSLRQPYANLILEGKKTIELRHWACKSEFTGRFIVHAVKHIDEEACERLKLDKSKFLTGVLLGESKVLTRYFFHSRHDLDTQYERHWAKEYFTKEELILGHAAGFVLETSEFRWFSDPVPYRGHLGFFEVPKDAVGHQWLKRTA